jgi:hypothetical protein
MVDSRSINEHRRFLDWLRSQARYDRALISDAQRQIDESFAVLRIVGAIQNEMLPNGRKRDKPL